MKYEYIVTYYHEQNNAVKKKNEGEKLNAQIRKIPLRKVKNMGAFKGSKELA